MAAYFRLLRVLLGFLSGSKKYLDPRMWHRFLRSRKGIGAVSVSVNSDGTAFELFFQRPIQPSDIREGKLVPTARTTVKRRGGKLQTELALSLAGAEDLYLLLGKAIKDANIKQRDMEILATTSNALFFLTEMQKAATDVPSSR